MNQYERFDDLTDTSASLWEIHNARVLNAALMHSSEMVVIGDDHSTSLSRMRKVGRVWGPPQPRIIGSQHIDSTLEELDRDSSFNVLIKLKPYVSHYGVEAFRGVGWGTAA